MSSFYSLYVWFSEILVQVSLTFSESYVELWSPIFLFILSHKISKFAFRRSFFLSAIHFPNQLTVMPGVYVLYIVYLSHYRLSISVELFQSPDIKILWPFCNGLLTFSSKMAHSTGLILPISGVSTGRVCY